jgi:hypothetical protein
MADQNKVLKLLAAAPAPLSIDALQKGMRRGGFAIPPRKAIIVTLGRLMERKFAERADAKTFGEKQRANWRRSGPLRGDQSRPRLHLRRQAYHGWALPPAHGADAGAAEHRAAENLERFSHFEEGHARRPGRSGGAAGADAGKTIENARKYLKGLCRAGIAVRAAGARAWACADVERLQALQPGPRSRPARARREPAPASSIPTSARPSPTRWRSDEPARRYQARAARGRRRGAEQAAGRGKGRSAGRQRRGARDAMRDLEHALFSMGHAGDIRFEYPNARRPEFHFWIEREVEAA